MEQDVSGRVELIQGDITQCAVEALVNAANRELILGAGVSGAIRRAGGDGIQEECNQIGAIPLGEAVVTKAGQLKAKYIIHAASMSLGTWTTTQSLFQAIQNTLKRAAELHVKTLAFPAIGTGVAAYPVHRCAEIMLTLIRNHLLKTPTLEKVFIALYDHETFQIFQEYYQYIILGLNPPDEA